MDGCEAASMIRGLDREDAATTPILALTANAFAEDVAASARAGMNAHIVAASGYSEEFAHDCHGIPCPVTIYNMVFYLCPHFLSVKRRKSRSNSFSIFSRLFSFS